MKKILAILLAAMMVLTVLAGCGQKEVDITPSEPPKEEPKNEPAAEPSAQPDAQPEVKAPEVPKPEGEGVLNVAATADVSTLNPQNYSMSRDSDAITRLTMFLYKSFISDAGTFQYLPEAAADFPQQMNEERTVWQIPIRKDMVWENGDPLDADDIIYTYKMLLDPKLLNSRASYFADNYIVILNASEYSKGECAWEDVGWKKVDDYTIEMTLKSAATVDEMMSQFDNTGLGLVHEATYQASISEDGATCMYGTDADHFMACGAFTIKEWIPGASISYQKNPNYVYADKVWVNTINERTVSDASTRLQLFLNGELDYVSLGDEEYKEYMEDPRVIESNATSMRHISVNMGNTEKAILSSTNFRLALYYATNRTELASLCNGIPAWWFQPTMVVGDLDNGANYREMFEKAHPEWVPANNGYNPELAVEYFEKALAETNTDKVELTLLYNSDTASYKACSEYLQRTWAEVLGADRFHIELQGMPNSQMTSTKKDWKNNANSYEISWGAWNTSKIAPWNAFNVWRTSYGKKNEPLSLPELDELWVRANQSEERFDKAGRIEMAYQMEKIMLDNAGVVPMLEVPSHYLKSERVILPTSDNHYVVNAGFGWDYAKVVD